MTKFLTDENIPSAIIDFLQGKDFDVKDVRGIGKSGASDEEVMELARNEERVLISFDKHFADIINYPLHSHFGIIRIRIHPPLIQSVIDSFERFLKQFDIGSIKGTLVILEKNGFRIRRVS